MTGGAVADTLASQVAGVTALWVITMSSLRIGVAGFSGAAPMLIAIVRSLGRQIESGEPGGWRMANALNAAQVRFLARMMTAWDLLLFFVGLGLLGVGLSLASIIDAIIMVEDSGAPWRAVDLRFDIIGAFFIWGGATMMTAAISARRSVSFIVSLAFLAAGVGISLVLALGVHQ